MYIAAAVVVLLVLAGLAVGREIIRSNYYVTEHEGIVSIMRGVQGSFLGYPLQEPYLLGCLNARNELSLISAGQTSDNLGCRLLAVADMRPSERAQVIAGLPSGSLDDAIRQIEELSRSSVLPVCAPRTTTRQPAPSPTTSPGAPPPATTGPAPTPTPSPRPGATPGPAPETPRTVTSPAPAPPPPPPPPTVTALPPPPPQPGTNCREVA